MQHQNTATWLYRESQKMPRSFVNSRVFKDKTTLSTFFSEKRRPQDKQNPPLTLTLSEKASSPDLASQAKACLSLIEDPLWKEVCRDVETLMGPIATLEIVNSQLGSFCHQHRAVDLLCKTRENVQFAQKFSFIILESLRRYFPTIQTLRVN